MKIPDALAARFEESSGKAPELALRALYDMWGELGESWIVTDGEQLAIYSKSLYEASHSERRIAKAEIRSLDIAEDCPFVRLEIDAGAGAVALRFSSWQRPQLEGLADLLGVTVGAGEATPEPELSAPVLFCALVQSVIEIDGQFDEREALSLSNAIGRTETVTAGQSFLRDRGNDVLLREAGDRLNDRQKRCALANMITVSMADGVVGTDEQDHLQAAREAMGVDRESYDALFEPLLAKHHIGVFPDPGESLRDEGGLAPVAVLCAAMQAMAHSDGNSDALEQQMLQHLFGNHAMVEAARSFRAEHGDAALLPMVGDRLDAPQKYCLLTNLLDLAMADGLLRSAEQSLLMQFLTATGLAQEEYEVLYQAILTKNALNVLFEEEG